MSRRAIALCAAVVLTGAGLAGADGPVPVWPEVRVEGGFDNAQVYGVRVEEAATFSPRVIIAGSIAVESMPEKGRDPNRHLYWHFRLDGCKGRTIRFELYYARASLWPLSVFTPTVVYDDGGVELMRGVRVTSYGPARGRFMEKAGVSWRHRFRSEPAKVSYCLPFTNDDATALAREMNGNPWVEVRELGRTPVFDLPLRQFVVTDPTVPDAEKKGIWLYAGEDPWEFPGVHALAGFLKFVAGDDPLAKTMRRKCIVSAIPHVNPDAVHRGDTNFSTDASGRDIVNTGLSWRRTDIPAHEMVKAALRKWKEDGRSVDLMATMHSSCFWNAVMRIDWAYDREVARRFIDEVYAKKYVPWAAGKGMATPSDLSGTLGVSLASVLWPDRLLFFGQHLEQVIMPKRELLGLPGATYPDDLPTDFLRLQREDLFAQGELFARAVAEFFGITVPAEKVSPFLMAGDVDRYWGKAGEPTIYTVLYRHTEGREPSFVRLNVGRRTVEMKRIAGVSPVRGYLYEATLPLTADDSGYWFTASDGTWTVRYPRTGRFSGPYVAEERQSGAGRSSPGTDR